MKKDNVPSDLNSIQKENLDILEKWYESISKYPKLKFSEAKNLYIKMLKEIDQEKKENMRQQLICGTLYSVYNRLKNSILNLKSSSYDMNDVIQSSVSNWIDYLDEGRLLNKINTFSQLVSGNSFFSKLGNELIDINTKIPFYYNLQNNVLDDIFNWFMNQKNSGLNMTYDYFKDYIEVFFNVNETTDENNIICMYNTLNDFFDYCLQNNIDVMDNRYKDKFLTEFYFEIGANLKKESIENIQINENNEMIDKVITDDVNECITDIVNFMLSEKDKIIISMRYGLFDGKEYSLKEISKYLNLSPSAIGQRQKYAFRKIRQILYNYSKYSSLNSHYSLIKKFRSYRDHYFK